MLFWATLETLYSNVSIYSNLWSCKNCCRQMPHPSIRLTQHDISARFDLKVYTLFPLDLYTSEDGNIYAYNGQPMGVSPIINRHHHYLSENWPFILLYKVSWLKHVGQSMAVSSLYAVFLDLSLFRSLIFMVCFQVTSDIYNYLETMLCVEK